MHASFESDTTLQQCQRPGINVLEKHKQSLHISPLSKRSLKVLHWPLQVTEQGNEGRHELC